MDTVKTISPASSLTNLLNFLGVSLLASVSSAMLLAGIVLLLSSAN